MNEKKKLPTIDDSELIAKAKVAMQFSYSPYSKFKVGACILSADGRTFTGCNIENASYGATNCAERTALPWPCAICRQVLNEFAPSIRVIVVHEDRKEEALLTELFPHAFGPNNGTNEFLC